MPVKGKTLICKNQTYILDFDSLTLLKGVHPPIFLPYLMGTVSVLKTDILSIISPRDSKSMKLAHKNGYSIPK